MIKKGDKMIDEFKNWLKQNVTKDCKSSIAYELCKHHINKLNPSQIEYEEMIKLTVDWIDF